MSADTQTIIALTSVAFVVSIIGSLGGVGGGALLIPLYSFIGGFDIRQSVVLSVITITGASLIRGVHALPRRQKYVKNRYLANYGIIKTTVPFSTNTAYLGLLLNQNLPIIVIFVIFVILMYYLIYKSWMKNWEYIKKFIRRRKKPKLSVNIDGLHLVLPITQIDSEEGYGETWADVVIHMVYILTGFAIVTFFTFMRNTNSMPWLIYLIQFAVMTAYGYICINDIKLLYRWRKKTGFHFVNGDIPWESKKDVILLVIISWVVGILSTMLGIGGSIVITPILLGLGVPPDSIVATGGIISFFSSMISSIQYIVAGDYIEFYLIFLFLGGFFGGATSIIITYIFRKGTKLIITSAITIVLVLSLILLIIFNILRMLENGVI